MSLRQYIAQRRSQQSLGQNLRSMGITVWGLRIFSSSLNLRHSNSFPCYLSSENFQVKPCASMWRVSTVLSLQHLDLVCKQTCATYTVITPSLEAQGCYGVLPTCASNMIAESSYICLSEKHTQYQLALVSRQCMSVVSPPRQYRLIKRGVQQSKEYTCAWHSTHATRA